MFKHIMAPLDLGALDKLEHAMAVTADAARHYGAKVTYVSATNTVPTSVAHTPEEFQEKLEKVAKAEAERHGIEADAHALVLHDTSADLDRHLVDTSKELGADLIIMASHDPNFTSFFWGSNGGKVAGHAKASVMLVRGQ